MLVVMKSSHIILVCVFYLANAGTFAQHNEDKDCPGPLKFYRALGCTPVYVSPNDKCPVNFQCRSIDNRAPDKCYFGGRAYNPDERPAADDTYPCDHCFCAKGDTYSRFACAIVDCFHPNPKPGCYQRRNATSCCPGFEVLCPKNPSEIPTCRVDGKVYKDGEPFTPASEPNKRCFCGPRYVGKNVAPFCRTLPRTECRTELHQGHLVARRCAPVYDADKSPQTTCPSSFRCQTPADKVIRIDGPKPEEVTCRFGDLSMNYGDELSMGDDFNSKCVKCRCEVGPTPTCQRLPRTECQ